MKRFEVLEKMLEYIEAGQLLEEVIIALDNDSAIDVLRFVARMHDINLHDIKN